MSSEWGDVELLPDTAIARAWKEAEQRKADDEARRLAVEEALAKALVELQIYDPLAPPDDPRLYEGTGIGVLYGLPGTERFKAELGDWQIVSRRTGEEGA